MLYDHGLNGKYHYCASWMMVFDRIKQSIASGEATAAIAKYGRDPNGARQAIFSPPLPAEVLKAMEAA